MQKDFTPDAGFELKDAGLVASSAAAQVDAEAKVVDLGANVRHDLRVIIDATAVEIASNDEVYTILAQVSDTVDFSGAIKNAGAIELAATEVAAGGADDAAAGRYELHFTNEVAGTNYRYLRIYTVVAGTVATGINYTAWGTVQA